MDKNSRAIYMMCELCDIALRMSRSIIFSSSDHLGGWVIYYSSSNSWKVYELMKLDDHTKIEEQEWHVFSPPQIVDKYILRKQFVSIFNIKAELSFRSYIWLQTIT